MRIIFSYPFVPNGVEIVIEEESPAILARLPGIWCIIKQLWKNR